MIIQVRYERRYDLYEWLAMQGKRIINNGYASTFAMAEQCGHNWIEFATLTGQIQETGND